MSAEPTASQGLERAVHGWPALLALLALGGAYALVSARFTLGPPWLMLALIVVGSIVGRGLHWRGLSREGHYAFLVVLVVLTVGVATSAAFLVQSLLTNRTEASDLLLSGALLWASNVLVFSVWYWETDGGGPHIRAQSAYRSTDLAFPQKVVDAPEMAGWMPLYLDYLFLAFNTSTAFSPTDTMILSRRAKLLMMLQSVISLTTIAVIAARAINTLPS